MPRLILLLAVAFAMPTCADAPPPGGDAPGTAQAAARSGMLVTTEWLADHLDDPDVVLLHADMRRDRYEEGHLPGARFLDVSRLVWDGDPEWGTEMRPVVDVQAAFEDAGVSAGQHLVIYAANALFSARAWMTLDVMGAGESASLLDGGLGAWVEEARPVSTEEPVFETGSFPLSEPSLALVSADWIHDRLGDEDIALVDARPDDEYTGTDGGLGGIANPGHIPGARQMYWEELIEGRPVHRMVDRAEAEALFREAGVVEGTTVVAYCQVGWRASYTYFVSRLLGYETRFYDGSWRDWGTRDDLPYVEGELPG